MTVRSRAHTARRPASSFQRCMATRTSSGSSASSSANDPVMATGKCAATTATPGSDARTATTAVSEVRYLKRFSRTERALHWVHASAFFVLLGSGLVLYLPSLAFVGNRPLVKSVHVDTAIAWAAALILVALLGDRAGLRRTLRELDAFDRDDRLWLRGIPVRQGRFNAGQKLNAEIGRASC